MKEKDDISIKLEKQTLIREEIINKGYDSIQFIEYLIQCKGPGGENINIWSIQDLKNAIKDFIYLNKNTSQNEKQNEKNNSENQNKIQGQTAVNKPLNKEEHKEINNENKLDMPAPLAPKEKNISESVLDNLIGIKNTLFLDNSKKIEEINYGLETPDILECRPVDKTDLSSHEELYIKIGFPEKIDGGFFGRDNVSFTVAAIPLGFVVKRNYFDFEWLKDILIKLYNSNFIPSLPSMFMYQKKNNEDLFFKECIRYLEKFMNYIILDPIIKNSQILYDFLCVENPNEFKKKQKEYENTTPSNDIQNNQSINGKIDINITEENEKKYNLIKNYCNENEKLFRQLNYNFNYIDEEFNNIIKKLNESSLIWEKLYNLNNKYNFKVNNYEKEIFMQMKNMFNILEKSLKKENDLLKIDIKENIFFFSHNLNNCELLFKKVDEYKRIYTKEEKDLISLKNELFNKSNILSKIENVDLSKLLPKNTESTIEMKKNYGYYLNRSITEFERMKLLDYGLFKDKISKCFKSLLDIINKFSGEIKEIVSTVNEIKNKNDKNDIDGKKDEKKDEQKEEKKDEKNNNEINNINKINSS